MDYFSYEYKSAPHGDYKAVSMSPVVLNLIMKGEKIKAIKQVRGEVDEYQNENGDYCSDMGLMEAKNAVEYWADLIWPHESVVCSHCGGTGYVESSNPNNPFHYKAE